MTRATTLTRSGIAASVAGLVVGCWGIIGLAAGTAVQGAAAATDPGCTPDAAGPGVVQVCLKESQEGTTAAAFTDNSCDQIANRDASLDYFVFVLPDSGDPGRTFVSVPAPTVYFDSGSTSGTVASNPKFFYASAAAGDTLLEAVAHADNGTGTPTGGEAQEFVLTHTCPATVTSTVSGSSTTSTGTSTGTETSTETSTGTGTTTTTSTATGGVSGSSTTSTSSTVTGSVSGISTGGGGVGGISTPNTGAGIALLSGLLLVGGGLTTVGIARRRRNLG